jgi:hypothetical protein
MIARLLLLGLAGLMLAGCQTTGPASVKGGECRIFERPEYAVLGKRQYDQDWIDGNVEAGVGGCGWKRPKARPASFDAVPGQKAAPAPVRKRGFVQRIKDRVLPPAAVEAPQPAQRPVERPDVVVAVPVPAPKPRDPVDELLRPQ